eukprot:3939441-Rhodomonas_salina.6
MKISYDMSGTGVCSPCTMSGTDAAYDAMPAAPYPYARCAPSCRGGGAQVSPYATLRDVRYWHIAHRVSRYALPTRCPVLTPRIAYLPTPALRDVRY